MRKQLSKLIKDSRLAELELKLASPNLFYVLKVQKLEIRHSNFLAWLLDPKGTHQLGDLFLRFVLRDLLSERDYGWIDEFAIDSMDLSEAIIKREWKHFDILIELKEFVVCIENKFWSGEHSSQLARYRKELDAEFADRNRILVFLTPHGSAPKKADDKSSYQAYSYASICNILEIIRVLYKSSIPFKVESYLAEYCAVIRREIMKDDDLNTLARSIYMNHKDALDFIIENRPDRLAEVAPMFERQVRDSGWVLGTTNKGYVRFLTAKLDTHLPKSGHLGWKGQESFLFELDFCPKTINCKTVISPGDERNKSLLTQAISEIGGASIPRRSQWIVHFNLKWNLDVTDSELGMDPILKKIRNIWPKIQSLVEKVENRLLKIDFDH